MQRAGGLHLPVRREVAAGEGVEVEGPRGSRTHEVTVRAEASRRAPAREQHPGVAARVRAEDVEACVHGALDVERPQAVDPAVDPAVEVQSPEIELGLSAELEEAGRRVPEQRVGELELVCHLGLTGYLDDERIGEHRAQSTVDAHRAHPSDRGTAGEAEGSDQLERIAVYVEPDAVEEHARADADVESRDATAKEVEAAVLEPEPGLDGVWMVEAQDHLRL